MDFTASPDKPEDKTINSGELESLRQETARLREELEALKRLVSSSGSNKENLQSIFDPQTAEPDDSAQSAEFRDKKPNIIGINSDILEQLTEKERSQNAETLFRSLFYSMPDAVLVTDGTGHYLDVNPAAIEMLGYSREEFLQMRSIDVVNSPTEISEEIWREFAEKGYWQAELELKHRKGHVILTDGRATLVDLSNNVRFGVAILRDITEKRKAQEAIFKKQQLFRHIIDYSDANIYVKDLEGRYILINHRIEELFGYSEGDIIGKTDADLFPDTLPESKAQWRANDSQVLSSEAPLNSEETLILADGEHNFLSTKFPLRDSNGTVYAICGISTDITERIRAEELLHRREQEFRALAENSPDVIVRIDRQLVLLYTNPAIERATGTNPVQAIGKTHREMGMPEKLSAEWEKVINAAFETANEISLEFDWPYPDDSGLHYYQARFVPELNVTGEVKTILGVIRDITEQKRLHQRLRFLSDISIVLASSLDYKATLQKVIELVVPFMADFCLIEIVKELNNSVAISNLDTSMEALAKKLLTSLPENQPLARVLETGQELLVPYLEEKLEDYANTPELLELYKQIGPKSLVCVPLLNQSQIIGSLLLITTESGRRFGPPDLELAKELARRISIAIENSQLFSEAQQAVQTRQELDDLKDFFMALVSHELRTPLTSIKGYAQLIQRQINRLELVEKPRMLNSVDTIVHQANRMNDMVTQLLDFSRIQNQQLQISFERVQNLNELVFRIVEHHRDTWINHNILLEISNTPTSLNLDPVRFEQVLDNLISNAVKYSESGTTVRVGLKTEPDEIILWVEDQGRGISQIDQDNIFNRFYRIRNDDNKKVDGLGLGLYISRQIIRLHGGRIWVDSEPGHGSTFYFSIPANN
jgi:PAS domain S-box-containing protein